MFAQKCEKLASLFIRYYGNTQTYWTLTDYILTTFPIWQLSMVLRLLTVPSRRYAKPNKSCQ